MNKLQIRHLAFRMLKAATQDELNAFATKAVYEGYWHFVKQVYYCRLSELTY